MASASTAASYWSAISAMAPSWHSIRLPMRRSIICAMRKAISYPSTVCGDSNSATAQASAGPMHSISRQDRTTKPKAFLAGLWQHPFQNLKPGPCSPQGSCFLGPLRTDEGSAPRETLNKSSWAVEYADY